MKLIEEYRHLEDGYNPFLIRTGWQVAQLNYVPGQGVDDIQKIDAHLETDEVFVLTNGRAVLIAAERNGDDIGYEMILMEPGVVYNIPKGMWHNIAMEKDAQIIIVEKDNTHLNDCEYHYLDDKQKEVLHQLIKDALK